MKKLISFALCFLFILGFNVNSFAVIGSSKGVPEDQEIPFFVNGGRYYIVNAHSNKLLNVANFGTTSDTNVVQWWNNGGTNNEWIITLLSDGYYKISPCHTSNMALDVLNNGTANGDNVGIYSVPSSGPYNSSRWSISRVASTGNFKIASKNSSGTKVLTVENASCDNGANVFMYDYSSSYPTNDEWIFIPVSSVNLVEIAIHQDPAYLTEFADSPSNINRVMADVGKPFYNNWAISLEPFYYNITYLPLQDCPFDYDEHCEEPECGNICVNSDTWPNHHKNFDYNAWFEWDNYGDDGKDLRLVVTAATLCHMSNGSHSYGPLGMASGINSMVFNNRGHMLNVRVIQHEFSHNFGCHDNCGASANNERCIMDGGFDNDYLFNLSSIWCSTCEDNFDRTAH